ncbi:outer membrane protein assembly factor BamB family protein [Thalassoroseus pseudoceratinae]|uniref:outer membrane protein assembly factor BamB family protein n=1 Tax=Thalassoroseus pseudoceratinae TaxID=2713176 RepID=UPI00197FE90E|nr:PQQ-binding-like beta-propeller repeat protein [Thalassoroseus pseudoceratinae]
MRILGLFCLSLVVLGQSVSAENWSAFRGPRGDGITPATGVPVEWSETKNIVWKQAIHGRGWSSPVIWDDQIWLTTATEDGKKQSVICVDATTGKILHDMVVFENENPRFCHPSNSYASCTPVIEEGRLYVHFGSYGTAAIDTTTGKVLWERRDLECDHFRAPASSPILYEDVLIVAYDGFDVQYVVGFDKQTGETRWRTPRDIDYNTDNGDRKKAYATGLVIEVDGKPQVILPSATATVAYEPLTGKEIWRVRHGGMNAACRPIYGHGMLYITAGDGGTSLVAVRPDGHGDVTDTHVVWSSGKSVPKRSSLILKGDLLFMTNDSGVVSCRDAKAGDVHWMKRLEGEYWASPLLAEDRLYFSSKTGLSPVLAASSEYELITENKLDAGFNASPAVIENDLILRTFTHLYRVSK